MEKDPEHLLLIVIMKSTFSILLHSQSYKGLRKRFLYQDTSMKRFRIPFTTDLYVVLP